jgi:hypothetical protein
VFADIGRPDQDFMFNKMSELGLLREGLSPRMCKISLISLMVFPFVAPPALLSLHGIEVNEEFLSELLEHNIALLKRGLLREPS